MKDSGVEWLGEVPEHWKVKRLKDIAEVIDCRNKTPEYFEAGDYLVVRTSNVKRQTLVLDEALYTDKRNFEIWTQRGIPQPGSILFTREAPTGEVCLVPEGVPLCMGQRMMNFVCHDDSFTGFLMIYLQSDCLTRYIQATSHGSTVSHLRVSQVESIPVIVPDQAEVPVISSQVDKLASGFNALMSEATQSISLMQERRSALISAAVTGQIDVRGLVSEAEVS
jgi:type I restriction enzyme S subunit